MNSSSEILTQRYYGAESYLSELKSLQNYGPMVTDLWNLHKFVKKHHKTIIRRQYALSLLTSDTFEKDLGSLM